MKKRKRYVWIVWSWLGPDGEEIKDACTVFKSRKKAEKFNKAIDDAGNETVDVTRHEVE